VVKTGAHAPVSFLRLDMRNVEKYEEFVDLVHQAVYEVDELRACMGDEEDFDMERYAPFIDALDASLRQLYDDIISGNYSGAGQGGDLSFMKIVNRFERDIPFRDLLKTINAAHRKGWR
jgi:hypothetical protein